MSHPMELRRLTDRDTPPGEELVELHATLTDPFEVHRAHLRAVAYRMLGSLSEADDAVQEAWIRLNRAEASEVNNVRGYLTTVVARVCLDALRSRKARREEQFEPAFGAPVATSSADPESEAMMADSVGLALLVVLQTLSPAERLAYVLHEMFGLPFEEIASIAKRSPAAVRQLASRARKRVRGSAHVSEADLASQREVVDGYLAALRSNDFERLVSLLDPQAIVRSDARAVRSGAAPEVRGAEHVARQALALARGARFARTALVDGRVGVVVAPRGRLLTVLSFTFAGAKITALEAIAEPASLMKLELSLLDDA